MDLLARVMRGAQKSADMITRVPPSTSGWWPVLREGFSGAWQRGIQAPLTDAATHPTFWSCLTLISGDIAKMRPMLMQEDSNGIDEEVESPAFSPVLDTPNHYQDRIQFLMYWMLSKLTRGNAYALKARDKRNVVTELYLLDPTRVRPLVSPSGDVFYALYQDQLAGIDAANVVVPAREIIHDRMFPIYHPLVGLSPVYAAGHAAILSLNIMRNTEMFAKNGSMIGGLLVAPGQISKDTADRLEALWNNQYAGPENAGKVAVIGDGMKYEKPNIMSAVDAQIIDQLKWNDEKICAAFHVPGYMVQVGAQPLNNNVEALAQQYYSQCLQIHIESIELSLTKGLNTDPFEVELDVDCLLRMDAMQKMDAATKGVIGGIYKPDEARAMFNLPPVPGGDQVYLQKQNWPLSELGSDAVTPTPVVPAITPPALVAPPKTALDMGALLTLVTKGLDTEAA